jgi:hypothetical protein
VAYASTESGDWGIYVTTFAGAAGKWQVSRGDGTEPRWRSDGKELYYVGESGMLMAAIVSTEGGFFAATPTALFPLRGRTHVSSTDLYTYDVTRDGQRFLVNRFVKADHPTPLYDWVTRDGRRGITLPFQRTKHGDLLFWLRLIFEMLRVAGPVVEGAERLVA